MSWLHGIIELMDRNLNQLWETVEAKAWCAADHGVAKSDTTNGLKNNSNDKLPLVSLLFGYFPILNPR